MDSLIKDQANWHNLFRSKIDVTNLKDLKNIEGTLMTLVLRNIKHYQNDQYIQDVIRKFLILVVIIPFKE